MVTVQESKDAPSLFRSSSMNHPKFTPLETQPEFSEVPLIPRGPMAYRVRLFQKRYINVAFWK
jgi:hypothetical protein